MNDKERYDQVKEIVDKALKGLAVLLKIGLPKPAAPEPSEFEKWNEQQGDCQHYAHRDSQYGWCLECRRAGYDAGRKVGYKKRGEDDVNSLPSCAIVGGNAAMYKSEAIEAIHKFDKEVDDG